MNFTLTFDPAFQSGERCADGCEQWDTVGAGGMPQNGRVTDFNNDCKQKPDNTAEFSL